jgi:pimeloyl-ACP methyl ester carboxylesterase
MIRVDGHDLHVVLTECAIRSGAGEVPVVLCGGLAGNWFDWDALAAVLARDRTVVRFDRPGFGLSAPSGMPPTAHGEADRIAAVLDAVDLSGPAIVVGHSLAGFYVEAFARLHPDRTAAVMLLDASVSGGSMGLIPRRWRLAAAGTVAAAVTATGLQRRLAVPVWRLLDHSADAGDARVVWVRRIWRSPSYLEAALVENAVFPDVAREVVALRTRTTLSAAVLVVAAHTGRPTPWGALWLRSQRRLASTLRARFEVLRPAHHVAMVDQPDRLADLIRTVAGSDPRR